MPDKYESNARILMEAHTVLRDDNLIWDEDFESIRKDLANLMHYEVNFYMTSGILNSKHVFNIARKVTGNA